MNIEDFERTLVPALVDRYEKQGWCYVVSGSTQRGPRGGRAERGARRRSPTTRRSSSAPTSSSTRARTGAARRPVDFNFDWSFDYYPLAYARPGPEMTIYRLNGGGLRPDRPTLAS